MADLRAYIGPVIQQVVQSYILGHRPGTVVSVLDQLLGLKTAPDRARIGSYREPLKALAETQFNAWLSEQEEIPSDSISKFGVFFDAVFDLYVEAGREVNFIC